MNTVSLGLDIGGTNIRAGVISEHKKLIGKIHSRVSPSNQVFEKAIDTILTLAQDSINEAKEKGVVVTSCGIGIPGPFNYEVGISQMKHKFQSLYGKNLKTICEQKLQIPVYFINDASAFGLGVSWAEYPDKKKILAITLGTGLGSSFIVNGKLGTQEDNISQNGELWNYPFREGILEDYVSKQAIEEQYKIKSGKQEEVETIAQKAREGDKAAQESFSFLAQNVGTGLAASASRFHPDIIVIGGKIGANAFDLFGKKAEKIFAESAGFSTPFVPTINEYLGIYGAAYHTMNNKSLRS